MARHGCVGLDIGGTKTLVTLFDDKFKVLEMDKFKTDAGKGEKAFDRHLTEALHKVLKKAKSEEMVIAAAGIGCAGRIDYKGMRLSVSPNIPFLKGYPLCEKVAKETGSEVFLGNDVQMGLYGEHQLGAAIGARHVLGVFLGTGIGGAMIIDGKLHLGTSGVAGDIGHYLVQPFGPLGGSERQGVLDDFASRTAIAATAAAYASKQWAPHLLEMAGTDLANMRSHVLAKAISKGDKQIEELIRSRARIVGIVLSNLIDFINPDMVVLGGGLVEEMAPLILKEVEAGIREHTTPEALEGLKVVATKLMGQAVATGAAKMAWDRYIEKQQAGSDMLTKSKAS